MKKLTLLPIFLSLFVVLSGCSNHSAKKGTAPANNVEFTGYGPVGNETTWSGQLSMTNDSENAQNYRDFLITQAPKFCGIYVSLNDCNKHNQYLRIRISTTQGLTHLLILTNRSDVHLSTGTNYNAMVDLKETPKIEGNTLTFYSDKLHDIIITIDEARSKSENSLFGNVHFYPKSTSPYEFKFHAELQRVH